MAQHKSAKKRIRQTERRTLVNRMQTSRMRTFLKKVETALASGDKTAAQQAFREAEPVIASAGGKGIIHRNAAARKISRLAKRVKALGA